MGRSRITSLLNPIVIIEYNLIAKADHACMAAGIRMNFTDLENLKITKSRLQQAS